MTNREVLFHIVATKQQQAKQQPSDMGAFTAIWVSISIVSNAIFEPHVPVITYPDIVYRSYLGAHK